MLRIFEKQSYPFDYLSIYITLSSMVNLFLVMYNCLKDLTRLRFGSRSGQAMTEFMIIAVVLIASLAILTVLLMTFEAYGDRVLGLAASEYP